MEEVPNLGAHVEVHRIFMTVSLLKGLGTRLMHMDVGLTSVIHVIFLVIVQMVLPSFLVDCKFTVAHVAEV